MVITWVFGSVLSSFKAQSTAQAGDRAGGLGEVKTCSELSQSQSVDLPVFLMRVWYWAVLHNDLF